MNEQDIIRESLTLSSLQRPRKLRVEEGLAALDALVARCEQAERQLETADRALIDCHVARREAEARLRQTEQALRDACDVAIWLSALVPQEGEAWDTWENVMRPKLYEAMAALDARLADQRSRREA